MRVHAKIIALILQRARISQSFVGGIHLAISVNLNVLKNGFVRFVFVENNYDELFTRDNVFVLENNGLST